MVLGIFNKNPTMLDLDADLSIFFNTAEFGDAATVALPGGSIDITGNASKYAHQKLERPGSNNSSGFGTFMAGAAEFSLHGSQYMTAWRAEYATLTECRLTIHTGKYAGEWRIRFIERDGDVARMILNKQ